MKQTRPITIEPLSREAFAPFGEVIATEGVDAFAINQGRTQRFHALARIELLGEGAQGILSIFRGQPLEPLNIALMERHPLGSQAFIPINGKAFYAVVAPPGDFDESRLRAFLVTGSQGINLRAGTWHAPLLPLSSDSDYLIVDRCGPGANCDEVQLSTALTLQPDSH